LAYLSSVEEYWDNLSSFRPLSNETLVLDGLYPSGGGFPRNFVINNRVNRVAVDLQTQHRVAVMERYIDSGEIGEVIANITIEGGSNCLVWDECYNSAKRSTASIIL
jgi:6-phosphogluconolactonase (cycloisomerase 2 family)